MLKFSCVVVSLVTKGVMEAFYRDLHNLLQQVNFSDKLLILGDFNARVGRDFELWMGELSRHEIDNCDDIGRLHQIQAPLRSLDGSTLLTDKESILQP